MQRKINTSRLAALFVLSVLTSTIFVSCGNQKLGKLDSEDGILIIPIGSSLETVKALGFNASVDEFTGETLYTNDAFTIAFANFCVEEPILFFNSNKLVEINGTVKSIISGTDVRGICRGLNGICGMDAIGQNRTLTDNDGNTTITGYNFWWRGKMLTVQLYTDYDTGGTFLYEYASDNNSQTGN